MSGFISEEKRQDGTLVSFLVSHEFTVPKYLRQASMEDCELVLKLSSSLLETKEHSYVDKCSQNILKDLSKSHHDSLEKLHQQYKHEINMLEKEKKSAEIRWEKHIRELEVHSTERISMLELELAKAKVSPESLRLQFAEESERRIKQKEEDLNKLLDYLKTQLEDQKKQIKEILEEKKQVEEKLQSHSLVMSNSSRKGNFGEQSFEQILIDKKQWYTVNASKKGHSMDRILNHEGVEVRFDIKNYTVPVGTAEVEKAKKDLLNHPETDIGVVVSLQTEIRGAKTITLLWTPQNQALLLIPYFLQQDIDVVLHFIEIIIDIMKPFRKLLQQEEKTETTILLKKKIEESIIHTQSSLTFNAEIISDFNKCYNAVETQLQQMKNTILGRLADQKTKLSLTLESLTGQEAKEDNEAPEKKKGGRRKKETNEDIKT